MITICRWNPKVGGKRYHYVQIRYVIKCYPLDYIQKNTQSVIRSIKSGSICMDIPGLKPFIRKYKDDLIYGILKLTKQDIKKFKH